MNGEMKKIQKNQNGGARPGAGRPKGSTTRPKITDYMTPEQIEDLIQTAISQAKEKSDLMKYILDHILGKPQQQIELNGEVTNRNINTEIDYDGKEYEAVRQAFLKSIPNTGVKE